MALELLKCLVPPFLIQDGPHIRLIPIGNVRECRSLQQIKDRYRNACYEQQRWSLLSYFQWHGAATTVVLYRDGNRLTYPEGSPAEINTAAKYLREGHRLVIIAFANIDQGKDQLKELGRSRVAEYHRDKADRIRIIVLQNTFGTLDEEDLTFIGNQDATAEAISDAEPGACGSRRLRQCCGCKRPARKCPPAAKIKLQQMASVLADKENPGPARTPAAAAATRVMSKLPLLASARSGVAATPALAMAAAKNAAIQRVSALALADVTNSTPLPNSKKHFRPGLASAKQAFAGATATKPSVQQNPPSHRRTALSNLAGPARGTSKSPADSASSAASSKTSSSRNSAPSRASATKRLISRVGNASNAKSSRFSVHHDAPPAPLAPKSASSNSSGLESRSVVGTDDQVFTDAPAALTDRITEAEMVPNAAFSVEDNVTQDDDSDDVPSIEYAPLNSKTDSAYFLDELADFSNISKPIWSDVFVIRPVDDDSLSRISMESEKSSFVGSTLDSFEVECSADIDDAYLTLQVEALMF